jgi:hypothetical protein
MIPHMSRRKPLIACQPDADERRAWDSLERRFLAKIDKYDVADPNGCWPWKGATVNNSGLIWAHGRVHTAPRAAYGLLNRRMPSKGLLINRKCSTPFCVNPGHLEAGSPKDYQRLVRWRGKQVSKLAEADVVNIRRLRRWHPDASLRKLAKAYGVCPRTIIAICGGETWRHAPAVDE